MADHVLGIERSEQRLGPGSEGEVGILPVLRRVQHRPQIRPPQSQHPVPRRLSRRVVRRGNAVHGIEDRAAQVGVRLHVPAGGVVLHQRQEVAPPGAPGAQLEEVVEEVRLVLRVLHAAVLHVLLLPRRRRLVYPRLPPPCPPPGLPAGRPLLHRRQRVVPRAVVRRRQAAERLVSDERRADRHGQAGQCQEGEAPGPPGPASAPGEDVPHGAVVRGAAVRVRVRSRSAVRVGLDRVTVPGRPAERRGSRWPGGPPVARPSPARRLICESPLGEPAAAHPSEIERGVGYPAKRGGGAPPDGTRDRPHYGAWTSAASQCPSRGVDQCKPTVPDG